jgi:hypothetical protein
VLKHAHKGVEISVFVYRVGSRLMKGLKNLLDKFHDFGYVKLRELEHGVAEAPQSSGHYRKIKTEDCVVAAALA